jgi:type IV secretory pathway VirB10-like protein
VIVLVVVAAIIYGRYPKSPQPPKGPTGDNPTPPGPTSPPPPPQNEDPKPQDEDPKAHGGNPPPPPQQEDKQDPKPTDKKELEEVQIQKPVAKARLTQIFNHIRSTVTNKRDSRNNANLEDIEFDTRNIDIFCIDGNITRNEIDFLISVFFDSGEENNKFITNNTVLDNNLKTVLDIQLKVKTCIDILLGVQQDSALCSVSDLALIYDTYMFEVPAAATILLFHKK